MCQKFWKRDVCKLVCLWFCFALFFVTECSSSEFKTKWNKTNLMNINIIEFWICKSWIWRLIKKLASNILRKLLLHLKYLGLPSCESPQNNLGWNSSWCNPPFLNFIRGGVPQSLWASCFSDWVTLQWRASQPCCYSILCWWMPAVPWRSFMFTSGGVS